MSRLRLARTRYGCIIPILILLLTASMINVAYAATGTTTTTSGSKSNLEIPRIFVTLAQAGAGILGLILTIDGAHKLGEGRAKELLGGLFTLGLAIALPFLLQMFGVKII